MRLMVSEIINKAKALPDDQAVDFLRANDSVPLRHTLKMGLCSTVEVLLPPGDPPYKPSEAVESHGMFFSEARKLYLFVRGGNDGLRQLKREVLFIQLLESVHPEDAKMLLLMKDKKIPLSVDVVNKAFPDLQIVPVPVPVAVEPVQEVAVVSTATKSPRPPAKKKPRANTEAIAAVTEILDEIKAIKKTPAPKKATKKKAVKKAKGEVGQNEQIS